jgi:hypothetical protein
MTPRKADSYSEYSVVIQINKLSSDKDILRLLNSMKKKKSVEPVEVKKETYTPDIDVKPEIEKMRSQLKEAKQPKGFFKKFMFRWNVKKLDAELASTLKRHEEYMAKKDANDKKAEITEYKDVLAVKSWYDVQGYIKKMQVKTMKAIFCNFELRNGKHVFFTINLDNPYFDYEGGRYIIDDYYKYYNETIKMFCLDYHQDCCLPLLRKFDLNQIRETLSADEGVAEVETAINPKSLKIFMESDIIQKVMKGAELEQYMAFLKMMMLIMTVMVFITMIMTFYIKWGKK